MAALNIAFEAPDNPGGVCPGQGRPIDLDHLARQTMGDKALELEVLQMFARQARESMKELAACEGEVTRDMLEEITEADAKAALVGEEEQKQADSENVAQLAERGEQE